VSDVGSVMIMCQTLAPLIYFMCQRVQNCSKNMLCVSECSIVLDILYASVSVELF
jgi:hypothetical protein